MPRYLKSYNINIENQSVELIWVNHRMIDIEVQTLGGRVFRLKNGEMERYETKEIIYDYEKAKKIIELEFEWEKLNDQCNK